MARVTRGRKLALMLWKHGVSFRYNWIGFFFYTFFKILLAGLASIVISAGVTRDKLYPLNANEKNITHNLTIMYSPNNSKTADELMTTFTGEEFSGVKTQAVATEKEIVALWQSAMEKNPDRRDVVGIVFEEANNKSLRYTIRLTDPLETIKNISSTYHLDYFFPIWRKHYLKFLAIQKAVSGRYLEHITGKSVSMSDPDYIGDKWEMDPTHKSYVLQIFACWTGLYIIAMLFRNVVLERETHTKDYLVALGFSTWMLWVCKIIDVTIKATIYNTAVSFVLTYVVRVHWAIIWAFMVLYSMKVAAFLFLMTVFFRNTFLACITVLLVWIISTYTGKIFDLFNIELQDENVVQFLCFFWPNMSITLGFLAITNLERAFFVDDASYAQEKENLFEIWFIMAGSTVLIWLLTIYLDPLMDTERGAEWKPWPFGRKRRRSPRGSVASLDEWAAGAGWAAGGQRAPFEPPPAHLYPVVRFRRVTKHIWVAGEKVPALDKLSIDIFKNEITVIIGENGCGKSTAMDMLTGWQVPSSGELTVAGLDTAEGEDMQIIRARIGWCPQENRVLPFMTARQYLELAGKMRGLPKDIRKKEVEYLLDILALTKIANKAPAGIPHTMLRRLCFAFAIIGKPPIIILDSPTAGVDIGWRREMWKLINELRTNRVIIIATNLMDEVEELADRVIVMSDGKLQSWGSPRFLNDFYGCGFEVRVERGARAAAAAVRSVVLHHAPEAERRPARRGLALFLLPARAAPRVPLLVRDLRRLGVARVALAPAGMEEVFLRATESTQKKKEFVAAPSRKASGFVYEADDNLVGCQKRLWALIRKELIHMKRSWSSYLVTAILVTTLCLTLMIMNTIKIETFVSKKVVLDLSLYQGVVVFDGEGKADDKLVHSYEELVREGKSTARRVDDAEAEFRRQDAEDHLFFNFMLLLGAHLSYSGANASVGTPLFSPFAAHSAPVAANLLANAFLRAQGFRDTSITVSNQPFPQRQFLPIGPLLRYSMWGTLMPLVLGMWLTCFARPCCEERAWGSQAAQEHAGASALMFWGARFLVHYATHALMAVLLLLATIASECVFSSPSCAEALFLIWLLYGLAGLPFLYLLCHIFKNSASVVVCMVIIILAGTIIMTCISVFKVILWLRPLIPILHWCPIVTSRQAMQRLSSMAFRDSPCRLEMLERCPQGAASLQRAKAEEFRTERPYVWELRDDLLEMTAQFAVYSLLVLALDSGLLQRLRQRLRRRRRGAFGELVEEGADMKEERRRALEAYQAFQPQPRGYCFVLPPPCALVSAELRLLPRRRLDPPLGGLSFRVRTGEVVALLGADSTGCSTILRMLGGQQVAAEGDVAGVTCRLKDNRSRFVRNLGFSGQAGGIVLCLTGREHLDLVCRLRNVSTKAFLRRWERVLGLRPLLPRLAAHMTAGQRRVLGAALALVGAPAAALLDLPMSGVDPGARRRLALAFDAHARAHRAVVFTSNEASHVEPACHRVALVRMGQILSMGSPLRLSDEFRTGYLVTFDVRDGAQDAARLHHAMRERFPNAVTFLGSNKAHVRFWVVSAALHWEQLVAGLEQALRAVGGAAAYSLRDAALQDVLVGSASDTRAGAYSAMPSMADV